LSKTSKMKQSALIQELITKTEAHIAFARSLTAEKPDLLKKSPPSGGWNVLQCLEHMNRYDRFYIDECGQKATQAKKVLADKVFKTSWLGKLFTKMMLPKKNMLKMKTFPDKNPKAGEVDERVLQIFIKQQKEWLSVLEEAKQVDLNKNRCNITLPLLSMNLGSSMRFDIYHNERHVAQAKRCLETHR